MTDQSFTHNTSLQQEHAALPGQLRPLHQVLISGGRVVALLHALIAPRRRAHLDLARLRRRPRPPRLLRRHVQDEGRIPLQKVGFFLTSFYSI